MKICMLLAALAVPIIGFASEPALVNPPATLPAGVTSVSPVQGFVNISGDVNPQGVGEISIAFAGTEDVVPNKNVKSELYLNGELLAYSTDAHIDAMGVRGASVIFGGARKNAGWYEVRIAEGQFAIGGVASPAITLYYQIENFCTIYPTPGVVEQVDNIFLYFDPDVVKVEIDETKLNDLSCLAHYTANGVAVTPEYQLSAVALNEGVEWAVAITFGSADGIAQTFFYEGNYNLNIPAGLVISYSKGANYDEDPTDLIVRRNPRYNFAYVIPSFEQPVIVPENESVVDDFYEFTVKLNTAVTTLLFADTMGTSHIYPVFDGQVDTSFPICKLRALATVYDDNDKNDNTVTYKVIDPATKQFATEPVKVEPGDYALVLADKSFSCMRLNDNTQVWAAPYQYFYTVRSRNSKVEEIAVEGEKSIYNLQGIRINRDADNLPAGLYIINGKKVLVK